VQHVCPERNGEFEASVAEQATSKYNEGGGSEEVVCCGLR
jgi:hypothetical protein